MRAGRAHAKWSLDFTARRYSTSYQCLQRKCYSSYRGTFFSHMNPVYGLCRVLSHSSRHVLTTRANHPTALLSVGRCPGSRRLLGYFGHNIDLLDMPHDCSRTPDLTVDWTTSRDMNSLKRLLHHDPIPTQWPSLPGGKHRTHKVRLAI